MKLAVSDLFVAGIGLDLIGAWLVARGLLVSLPLSKSFGAHTGMGVPEVVDRARNRVDGQFGVCYLLLGFGLQLGGYLAVLAGASVRQGAQRMWGALALLVATQLLAYGAWRVTRRWLFRRTLVETARAPLRTGGGDIFQDGEANQRWLALYGKAAGWQPELYESDASYVRRVFGIEAEELEGG